MSCNAFPSEALYEADKALEKFAAALQVFTRWRIEQTVNRKCMFYFVICVICALTASIFVYVCFVDCCIAAKR